MVLSHLGWQLIALMLVLACQLKLASWRVVQLLLTMVSQIWVVQMQHAALVKLLLLLVLLLALVALAAARGAPVCQQQHLGCGWKRATC